MKPNEKTIRLIMPQWQGGNNPVYVLGAELLAWLAPETNAPTIRIPVTPPNERLANENGIIGRSQLVQQLASAWEAIREQQPDKIVVLGGDCLVDLAPFAYLSERYRETMGILWIDTHPDVMTPSEYEHAHAHVLGALMGSGDPALVSGVRYPVMPENVMIAGIHSPTDYEARFIKEKGILTLSPEEVRGRGDTLREWITSRNITHLAIHLDLDVLSACKFRSVLFAKPDDKPAWFDEVAQGRLEIDDVLSLIKTADSLTNIVGIGIAEHLPWDALNLKTMLAQLPLLATSKS